MDNVIHYLNTDLDLVSKEDLSELVNVFEAAGASPLHIARWEDGTWHATIETDDQHSEPDPNISQLLELVSKLSESKLAPCMEFG